MTQQYSYTGNVENYFVPLDTSCVMIECWGASGTGPSLGGYVQGTAAVVPASTLKVFVGGANRDGNGIVDGGRGGDVISNGGGGSFVAPLAYLVTSDFIAVAGGGGGQGLPITVTGGDGGGVMGGNGASGVISGQGGSSTAAGAGGVFIVNGNSGTNGNGGDNQSPFVSGGGGGGGGLWGGGAGGGGGSVILRQYGAGGGGSGGFPNPSFVPIGPFVNAASFDAGYVANPNGPGDGFIRITPVVCPCLAEGTMVCLMSGYQVPIEQLRRGQILQSASNRHVRIEQAIRFQVPGRQFVRIAASALGRNQPAQDLLIREGHPLLVQSREVMPEHLLHLPGVERVTLEQPTYIYTLVTEQKQFVNMQGAMVATWSREAWDNEVRTKAMLFDSQ